MHLVIPGLTRSPSRLWRDFWIPAFAGMTRSLVVLVINDAVYSSIYSSAVSAFSAVNWG